MLEELKKILTEVRSTKGKYHSSEVSNEEIAKVIYDALIPQGDDEKYTVLDWIRPDLIQLALHTENKLRDHDPQKGDSWKHCKVSFLEDKLREEFAEWSARGEREELLDMTAVIMMLWRRSFDEPVQRG